MVIRDALGDGAKQLKKTADTWSSAALDAELLLGHALRMTREELYLRNTQRLTAGETRRFHSLLSRRKKHEPVAYILHRKDFFNLSFSVKRGVCLIPRPETEILVTRAIDLLTHTPRFVPQVPGSRFHEAAIFDIGTGSGAIAISIAHALPDRSVLATDISPIALRLARKNAVQNGVADRISFQKAHLLPQQNKKSPWPAPMQKRPFLFCANLPYIPTRRWRSLPLGIRRFEPRSAFDGGPDGLALYRTLLLQIAERVDIDTWTLLAEIDPGQTQAFSRAVRACFPSAEMIFHRDLAKNIRCAEITVRSGASRHSQQERSAQA